LVLGTASISFHQNDSYGRPKCFNFGYPKFTTINVSYTNKVVILSVFIY